MGMYDHLRFLDVNDAPKCAAGHRLHEVELQTKDFDCDLDTYLVLDGVLFREYGGLRADVVTVTKREHVDNDVITTWQTKAPLVPFTGYVHTYTSCRTCLPVLEYRPGTFGDGIQEHYPWCEFKIEFRDGSLERVSPVRVETRDQLRAQWPGTIPDTDHIAQKHFERLRIEDEVFEKTYGRKKHR